MDIPYILLIPIWIYISRCLLIIIFTLKGDIVFCYFRTINVYKFLYIQNILML